MKSLFASTSVLLLLVSCAQQVDNAKYTDTGGPVANPTDTTKVATEVLPAVKLKNVPKPINITNEQILAHAMTYIGTPYLYGSADRTKGLDCSGFITSVYKTLNINVPRSSVEFTNLGKEVTLKNAIPGNLILFTGTDSTIRVVGHMGIVVENKNDTLKFIHSSSGKANGVTISTLDNYYKGRFVKVIDIM